MYHTEGNSGKATRCLCYNATHTSNIFTHMHTHTITQFYYLSLKLKIRINVILNSKKMPLHINLHRFDLN